MNVGKENERSKFLVTVGGKSRSHLLRGTMAENKGNGRDFCWGREIMSAKEDSGKVIEWAVW